MSEGDAVGKPVRPPFTQLPSGGGAAAESEIHTVEIGQVVQGILSGKTSVRVVYNKVIIRRNGQMVMSVGFPERSHDLPGYRKTPTQPTLLP